MYVALSKEAENVQKQGKEVLDVNQRNPYRKHKLVSGCYKVVDKVNYNLVATLLQGCDNLVSTL